MIEPNVRVEAFPGVGSLQQLPRSERETSDRTLASNDLDRFQSEPPKRPRLDEAVDEPVEDVVKAEPAGTESKHDRFHAQSTRHPSLRTSSFCGNAEK